MAPISMDKRLKIALAVAVLVMCIVSPHGFAASSSDTAEPVTVRRTLTVESIASDTVWLADLTSPTQATDTYEHAFALRWRLSGSWFPVWSLELTTDYGLIPQLGSGSQVLRLAGDSPTPGHTYDVVMSYEPNLGALSVRVTDITAQKVLYANTLEVASFDKPLSSTSGIVQEGYVPYGTTWSLGSQAQGSFLSLRILESLEPDVGIRLETPFPYPPGTFHIWIVDGENEKRVASLVAEQERTWVPLDITELPFGQFQVRVDYEDGGRVLMQDFVTVTRGRVSLQLASVVVNQETGTFSGQYSMRSDSALPPLDITIEPTVVPLRWDPASFSYVQSGLKQRLSPQTTTVRADQGSGVPFAGSIESTDEDPTWLIDLDLSVEPNVAVSVVGQSHVAHFGPDPDFKVMSLNIRYPSSNDGDNVWPNRRELTTRVILEQAPDIIGLQEPWDVQLAHLDQALTHYERVSMRPDPGMGEHNAIYYNTERFELVDWGPFWLSATPDVRYSATWGNSIVRGVIWARLRMRENGKEVVVFNTHFHHTGDAETMRTRSAELIVERVKTLAANDPVVVMGDFNTSPSSRAHAILTAESGLLYDAWTAAAIQRGPEGTTHGFTGAVGGNRIDWILLGGGLRVLEAEHVIAQQGNVFPSDHVPVVASVYWPE